jgi:hypothetical protein
MRLLIKQIRKLFGKALEEPESNALKTWERMGKPVPPPHLVKQLVIASLQAQYNYNLFIETGTYLGDMIEAPKNKFKQLYSIELGEDLYNKAIKRFEHDHHVNIINGDSGVVLINLCQNIDQPAIFWLDGHYSAGITAKGEKSCPIYEELDAIFNSKPFDHILLIDDARLFLGEDDYPTIARLTGYIKKNRPFAEIIIEHDMIKVYLKSHPENIH